MPKTAPTRSKRTARITNVHHLWEIIAPLLIRMRKADCGEKLPPKILKPIILQPGTAQAKVYRQHLLHPPLFSQGRCSKGRSRKAELRKKKGGSPTSSFLTHNSSFAQPVSGFARTVMQLNILRQAALCPHAAALGRVRSAGPGPRRSWTDFNPKLAANIALVADLLERGEQVLVGSPFREYSDALHYRLTEAGVSSLLLDGRTPPTARGDLVEGFKTGANAVLVAGLDAMGEGYNLDNCAHLILPALSWAMDINEQFIHRVWRLTSTRPVTIYTLVIAGTIDERLYESFAEKSTSAQMAIDRALHSDAVAEVDLDALLSGCVQSFKANAATLDEAAMEEQWTAKLRGRLGKAEVKWRKLARKAKV